MNLINIENLTKVYTERKLFDNTSFSLQDGEKVGIIGINGTGKTTLLRMIMGEEETDEGTITTANHVVMRYLPQHPEFEPEKSSLECVLEGNVTEENRWSVESDAKAMMTRLGIKDFMQPAGQLSGGQRKRLALISVLLSPADILLLDEPTNHLDNDMADWLEDYLKKWRGALIMVTHDRYFLDSVCNRIVEIDKGKIYSYQTNYSGYLELKTQRQEMEAASERKRQSILRVELEWIRRGARARSTKQKAHIQRYEELRDRQAPVQDSQVELSSISTRMGKTTVELENICKSYGERKLIDDFSYIFLKGDRVGFIGPNGCGKSTLMKIIAGIIPQDSGQVIIGQTVKMGYYAQEIASEKNEDAQEEAEITILEVSYLGGFVKYDLHTKDGKVDVVRSYYKYENGDMYREVTGSYQAEYWNYTEDGYLMFSGVWFSEELYVLTLSGAEEHTALRVQPLDETYRELSRKYLLPIGFEQNNMFIVDWSEDDFGDLNFYDMYDLLYQKINGTYTPYVADDNLGVGAVYRIPKDDFESVIMAYFNIDSETLQSKTIYYAEDETYEYKPRGFEEVEYPEYPYSEVVGFTENSDGTLTLTANVVFPYVGDSKVYAHEVVVRPLENGGVQYVSNRIIPSEDNCEETWHTPRLTAKEWDEIYGGK